MTELVYKDRMQSRLQQTIAMLSDGEITRLFLHVTPDESRVLISALPIRVLNRISYDFPAGFFESLPVSTMDEAAVVKAVTRLLDRINVMCENEGALPPRESNSESLSVRIVDFFASRFGRISIKP